MPVLQPPNVRSLRPGRAARGGDLRALPLLTRKEMLKVVLKDSTRIRYTQHVGENGVRLPDGGGATHRRHRRQAR
jgi:hypothetical protein